MCDLFALSANRDYSDPKSLPVFAEQAGKNLDGWGIGYFRNHHACVEKAAKGNFVAGQLHCSTAGGCRSTQFDQKRNLGKPSFIRAFSGWLEW
jgi:predicted glutamine amidotransferase